MLALLQKESALVGGLVAAIIGLVVSFGVTLTDAQQGAILTLTAVVVSVLVRSRVSPKA